MRNNSSAVHGASPMAHADDSCGSMGTTPAAISCGIVPPSCWGRSGTTACGRFAGSSSITRRVEKNVNSSDDDYPWRLPAIATPGDVAGDGAEMSGPRQGGPMRVHAVLEAAAAASGKIKPGGGGIDSRMHRAAAAAAAGGGTAAMMATEDSDGGEGEGASSAGARAGVEHAAAHELNDHAAAPAQLGIEDLRRLFHLPRAAAAATLGIAVSSLKKVCRRLGVERWPGRKLRSLGNLQRATQALSGQDDQVAASIQAEMNRVFEDPNHMIDGSLRALRTLTYKQTYKSLRKNGCAASSGQVQPRKQQRALGGTAKQPSSPARAFSFGISPLHHLKQREPASAGVGCRKQPAGVEVRGTAIGAEVHGTAIGSSAGRMLWGSAGAIDDDGREERDNVAAPAGAAAAAAAAHASDQRPTTGDGSGTKLPRMQSAPVATPASISVSPVLRPAFSLPFASDGLQNNLRLQPNNTQQIIALQLARPELAAQVGVPIRCGLPRPPAASSSAAAVLAAAPAAAGLASAATPWAQEPPGLSVAAPRVLALDSGGCGASRRFDWQAWLADECRSAWRLQPYEEEGPLDRSRQWHQPLLRGLSDLGALSRASQQQALGEGPPRPQVQCDWRQQHRQQQQQQWHPFMLPDPSAPMQPVQAFLYSEARAVGSLRQASPTVPKAAAAPAAAAAAGGTRRNAPLISLNVTERGIHHPVPAAWAAPAARRAAVALPLDPCRCGSHPQDPRAGGASGTAFAVAAAASGADWRSYQVQLDGAVPAHAASPAAPAAPAVPVTARRIPGLLVDPRIFETRRPSGPF